jgi:ABC-type transporter Mla subunit MlaD
MFPRNAAYAVCLGLFAALAAAQTGGLTPPWDVRKNVTALAAEAQRVQPVLEQLRPEEWVRQGASESYVAQLKTTRAQLEALLDTAGKLAADPERLTAALEVFFRTESLEALLRSLSGGVRRYQNAALADLLDSLFTESASSREKLREYIVELAADQEQAWKIMDQEAQRCRALLVRQPPAKNAVKKGVQP